MIVPEHEKGIIGLYQRHGLDWARDRGDRFYEGVWFERFCAMLQPGGAVLDLGCGSGRPLARHLIGQGFRVTGVDAAPGLLGLARESFPEQEWILADMRTLSLGRTFDGVLAWDSFFHLGFDAQRAMFPRFRAHAAPGAPLMFTSGPAHREAVGSYGGEPMYHASLAPSEYRVLLDANGFDERGHVAEDKQCGGRTVWLAQAQ